MPYDGIDYRPESETVRVLRAAKALIDSPEKWQCGNDPEDPGHCAEEALGLANGLRSRWREWADDGVSRTRLIGMAELEAAAWEVSGGTYVSPWMVNDSADHSTVMRMFDRAIEIAFERAAETADVR